jgi:replicative DNA helicase
MSSRFETHLSYLVGALGNYPSDGRRICTTLLAHTEYLPQVIRDLLPIALEAYHKNEFAEWPELADIADAKGKPHLRQALISTKDQASSSMWEWHCERLLELVKIERIRKDISSIDFDGPLTAIMERIGELSKHNANVTGFFSDLEKEADFILSGKSIPRIATGLSEIDNLIGGGFPLGDVSVIAGSTGSGKSALALNAVYHALKFELANVTIYSLEMTAGTNLRRLASIHSGIPAKRIGEDQASRSALEAFTRAYKKGLLKIRSASTNLAQIRAQAVADAKWSDKPNLVLVDYTGLVQHKGSSSYERMSEISRELRQVALDSNTALVEVVQLNREYRKHNDTHSDERAPILSDLRDSGQIEQDASVILMIHKPRDGQDDPMTGGPLFWQDREVWVRKSRDGQADVFGKTEFNGPTFKFRDKQ